MKREDILIQGLRELRLGHSVDDVASRLPTEAREEIEPLLQLGLSLQELPQNIELAPTSKARLRAQLLAEIRQPAPATGIAAWREAIASFFSPQSFKPLLVRPMGAAFSAFVALSLVGGGTVSAALDSIPGDGLYPVKTAVEQARLTLNTDDQDKAQTYLWMATSRVDELNKLVDAGRISEASKVVAGYEHSVSEALRLASAQKQHESTLRDQVSNIQTSIKEAYNKAPQEVQSIMSQTLALVSAKAGPDAATAREPQTTAPTTPTVPPVAETTPAAEESATTAGLPPDPVLPRDKTGVAASPPPDKSSPISNPPAPLPVEVPPAKGTIGPETKPIVTSETPAPVAASVDIEPGKEAPVEASTSPTSDMGIPAKGLNGDNTPAGRGFGNIQTAGAGVGSAQPFAA